MLEYLFRFICAFLGHRLVERSTYFVEDGLWIETIVQCKHCEHVKRQSLEIVEGYEFWNQASCFEGEIL